MDGIKKSAVFLSGLEWQTVDKLLGRLEPEQARAVRREMMSLELQSVSASETDNLAMEFLHAAGKKGRNKVIEHQLAAPAVSSMTHSATYAPPRRRGVNVAANPATDTTPRFSEQDWQPKHYVEPKAEKPFAFFRNMPVGEIVREIAQEHPQTVAVVLAHLPGSLAREVLGELLPSMRHEVTRRLAEFEVPDEDVLRDIETSIRERFEERCRERQRRAAVRQILGVED